MATVAGVSPTVNSSHEITCSESQLDLPIEIVIYIMKYLTLSDRINASQVCQTWYEASRDQKLHKKEVVVIQDNFNRSLDCLLSSTGTFINFLFKEVELNVKLIPFWEKYCPQIQSLGIHSCVVSERMFVDILSRCNHLESLCLNNCRELLMSGRVLETEGEVLLLRKTLVKLKELSLTHNRYMSDAIFYRFVSIAPNVQELALTGCQITFHHGLYQKFYPPANEEYNFVLSETVFTFKVILKYIKEQAKKLRVLKLGFTLVDNSALSQLAKVPDLNIVCLHLQSCNQLTNTGLIELANYQTSLTELDLSGCSRLTDQALIAICQNLVNLESLNVRNCRAVTNIGVSKFVNLKYLKSLNLAQCEMVTGEGVVNGICPKENTKLQSLNLCALLMDEESVCKVAENLPNLEFLDLSWCFHALTDRSAQAICTNLLFLHTLKLTACDKVSDCGLTGDQVIDLSDLSKATVELTESDDEEWNDTLHKISLRSRAEREIVKDALRKKAAYKKCAFVKAGTEANGNCLDRIQGLRYLDISGCNRITDVSLQYAFHFPGLQYLDLSRCQQVTHIGLHALSTNNPSIETLIMVDCYNITDKAVLTVVQHLKRLKHLDLQDCRLLSDSSLEAMGKYGTCLQYVNVANCSAMSVKATAQLETLLPTLRTLHRTGLRTDLCYTSESESSFTPPPPPPPGKKNRFRCFQR